MIRTFPRQVRFQSTFNLLGFNKKLSQNKIFQKIWENKSLKEVELESNTNDDFNALTTLPSPLNSRDHILEYIALEHPHLDKGSLALKFKQNWGYVKKLFGFYKTGINNVLNNRKIVNELKKKYYYENVEERGKVTKRKFKTSSILINKLVEIKSLRNIENEVNAKSEYLINLKRSEFQLILRTERDFYKIPLFSMVLLIFAETTPLLCYFIPEITPSTCILPNVSKKLHEAQTKSFIELANLRKERYKEYYSKGEIPLKFNYENLPKDELYLICKSFKLTSRFLPIKFYPEIILRERLSNKLKEFEIDNEYLINGGLWKLTSVELFKVCLDRGLINFDTYKDLKEISANELRLKIALQLSLINNNIIGNINIYGANYLNLETSPSFKDYTRGEAEEIFTKKISN